MKYPVGQSQRGGMPVEEFVGMLDKVRKHHDGWIACCPSHNDTNPSLVIHERDDRILLHCYAGCRAIDIVHAMGLKLSDLFNDREPTDPVKRSEWRRKKTMAHKMAAMNRMLHVTHRMQVEIASNPSTKWRDMLLRRYGDVLAQTLVDVGEAK